jgi:hypothetical protein
MVVVGGATVDFARKSATMLIIGIILVFVGLAYLCWLLFALAVHALPFFVGATAGVAAYQSGSGPIGAILVGAMEQCHPRYRTHRVHDVTVLSDPGRGRAALCHTGRCGRLSCRTGFALIAIPAEDWRHILAVSAAIIIAVTA